MKQIFIRNILLLTELTQKNKSEMVDNSNFYIVAYLLSLLLLYSIFNISMVLGAQL